MALCRCSSILCNPPWQQVLARRNFSIIHRPPKSNKFTQLPLLTLPDHRRKIAACVSPSPSMEAPPDGYRRNVGICLMNPSKKIFSASRLDVQGAWQMPQGGIDEGEDPRDAAVRELREETGVTSAEIIAEGLCVSALC